MSRQLWRSVADDRAACSVAARVEVARDAQKTDGEQSLKGLLLSRTATINAKPELEIFADDVKCAHGASVGELDRQALFYLESRGIAPEEARRPAHPGLRRRRAGSRRRRGGQGGVLRGRGAVVRRFAVRPRALRAPSPQGRGRKCLMDALVTTRPLDRRVDFPAIPEGWAYLDSAATAQKPRAVLDAIAKGYGETYATVHRGVYQRSAEMTLAFEASRRAGRGVHRRGVGRGDRLRPRRDRGDQPRRAKLAEAGRPRPALDARTSFQHRPLAARRGGDRRRAR